jgi:hypothetical protein
MVRREHCPLWKTDASLTLHHALKLTNTYCCLAELEEVEDGDMDKMRVIAIESKLEWREFTDEMKMVCAILWTATLRVMPSLFSLV